MLTYLKAVSDTFKTQFKYVDTLGQWREHFLREFIKSHIPEHFHVSTGFIYGDSNNISPQIDILIHESSRYAPLFQFGDTAVVRPESAWCAIEVKSRLTSNNKSGLYKAIEDAIKIRKTKEGKGTAIRCDLIYFEGLREKNVLKNIATFPSEPSYSLDGIHCFGKGQGSIVYTGVEKGEKRLHSIGEYQTFCPLKNADERKKGNNKAVISFFLLLLDFLEIMQGHFDKRFGKGLNLDCYLRNPTLYGRLFKETGIKIDESRRVILGGK